MPGDPQQVQTIFGKAVQKPEPERAEFLERACGGDNELRQRVEALIEAHEHSGSFLDSPPKDLAATNPTIAHTLPEQAGSLIGPFKLLQQIGEGGMGSVYMAEQIEPVERRVALKIIKPGMDTKAVIARFEAERQALAMMDHPGIAKVLDVGTTNSGRPYFVMELVRGVPITQYCDDHQLTPRQRLELFLPVCQAVQHAHQKGIIHRDIKPSNVLVAEYDDRPVPKIIDFGLAKAMEKRLTAKTMFTEFGQIVGTPDYMSPEQAKLNQMDIDTRSDIYSLGVLLYELLSGNTPFDRQRMRSAAFDELLRIIREEEPPRPSQRLSTVETLPSIAANRHISPAELTRQLSGELDWIVMKTLEKDRTRRYETATGLANDIRRFLDDEPVQACPPSAAYRLSKFTRRNRLPLTIAAVAIVSLIAISVGSVITATSFKDLATREGAAKQNAERAQDSAQAAQRREKQERERATAHLYDSLIREVQSIRQARATGYRDVAWKRLLDARQLDTPKVDLAQLQAEAVSCLGDFAGILPSEIKFDENVTATAVGPGAAQLAVGLGGGDTIVYDVENDRVLQRLPGHQEPIITVNFSRDQHTLVTGGSLGTVDIWQLKNGVYRHIKTARAGQVLKRFNESIVPQPLSCVLDADSRYLAIAYAGQKAVRLHGLQSDDDHKVFRMASGEYVKSAAISPDGQSLIAMTSDLTEDSSLVVWNVEREEVIARQSPQLGFGNSVVLGRSGKSIACSFDQGVKILDTDSLVETFSIRGSIVKRLAISPDGRWLAYHARRSDTISLWNLLTGRLEVELEHSNPTSLQFASEAPVLVSSVGKSVRLWRMGFTPEMQLLAGHQLGVPGVAFSPDNSQLASCSKDRTVKIWDTHTGSLIQSLDGFSASVQGVAFSPTGEWLATCDWSGSVCIWDATHWRRVGQLDTNRYGIGRGLWSIKFSPNEEFLSVSAGSGIVVWKADDIRRLTTAMPPSEPIPVHKTLPSGHARAIAFSPDSSMLASTSLASDGIRLRIWQTSTGKELWSPPVSLAKGVVNAFFYPDSRHVMFHATDGTAHTWDLVDRKLKNATPAESRVSLSPDGRLLVNSGGIRRVDTNELVVPSLPSRSGPGEMWCAAWSSDRQKLALSFSDGRIALWNLRQLRSRLSEIGLAWTALPPATQPYLKIQPRELTVGQQSAVAEAFRRRGVEYLSNYDFVRAEQDLVDCQKLVPNSPYARWDDFFLRLSQHNWEKIIAGSRQLNRESIDDQLGKKVANCATNLSWKWATDIQAEQPQLDAAVVLAEMAVDFAPDDANNWNNLGVAQYRASDFGAALQALLKADGMIEGGDRVHRMFLAMTLQQLGQTDEARQVYAEGAAWLAALTKQIAELNNFRAEAEGVLGIDSKQREGLIAAYFSGPPPADAMEGFFRSRALWHSDHGDAEPDDSGSYLGSYARALVARGKRSEYREFCAELLERHSQTSDPVIARSITYPLLLGPDAVDDWSLPVKLSQLVLSSGSGKHGAKSHVSELLCRAGEYDRSLNLRASAIAEAGRDPNGWDCFWQSMAHHGLGNIDQARELASRAQELADSDRLGANNHDEFEMMFIELTGKLNQPAKPLSIEDATDRP